MESQIWSRSEKSWTMILVLTDHEVHKLKVIPDLLTLNRNIQKALDALHEGQDPTKVGAKSVETLDVRCIGKAEVRPNDQSFILHNAGEGAKRLIFVTGNPGAGAIVEAILDRSGRSYEPKKEEVSVFCALLEPVLCGAFGGILCAWLYHTASKIAAGEEIVAKARNQVAEQALIWLAGTLGVNGSLAICVTLLVFIVAWTARRIVHRLATDWHGIGRHHAHVETDAVEDLAERHQKAT